ncbi:bacillithiol system protein YtxJ [Evansella vedderi]|uniref:Bacillithiol system protein YtxJ n=1 Tax=Evansella vedderi TaxID=38282 RepID=A0ABT9ZW70_9BACI|nr:bacillithiol system redox-active protein YtxJ [Evansella vedderi]MDQ0254997.1 bacillithiol system protein YtxJ [Evansella vedderi]
MSLKKISSSYEFKEIVKSEGKFFFLKNSTTCPISHEAFNQTEAYSQENEGVPVFYLNVQEARPLSNEISEEYGVKHESPQILLFEGEKVLWHDSHWNVTKKKLGEVWSTN